MFDITTNEPHHLSIHVDGLFHVILNRQDDGLSLYVHAAQTGACITESFVTNGEALDLND